MHQRFDETTILVVDDSASVRKLVELTLRRKGFSIVSATSGIAALASLSESTPDLILLDVMLDELNGFQLCKAIRKHPDYSDIPIVILSGREGKADRQAGVDAGVNAYLTKPFKPDQLIAAVEEQLSSTSRVKIS